MIKKLPSFSQWKQLFKVLKKKEKIALVTLGMVAIGSFAFFAIAAYLNNTKPAPAMGGSYTEGIVGQPHFINPLYDETNDVDRALTDLTFSGLMTYDNHGHVVKDLAESYTVSADGKTYDFRLAGNAVWHDGKPVTADDVVFTIQAIQNPDFKSPLRANWIDVDAQKVSDRAVRFILKTPYASFLENCTVKILPAHIWQGMSADTFSLSPYNLQPVGSGPYRFKDIQQANNGFITSLTLEANRQYYHTPPFISNLTFDFFDSAKSLADAAKQKMIDGFTLAAFDDNQAQAMQAIPASALNGS